MQQVGDLDMVETANSAAWRVSLAALVLAASRRLPEELLGAC